MTRWRILAGALLVLNLVALAAAAAPGRGTVKSDGATTFTSVQDFAADAKLLEVAEPTGWSAALSFETATLRVVELEVESYQVHVPGREPVQHVRPISETSGSETRLEHALQVLALEDEAFLRIVSSSETFEVASAQPDARFGPAAYWHGSDTSELGYATAVNGVALRAQGISSHVELLSDVDVRLEGDIVVVMTGVRIVHSQGELDAERRVAEGSFVDPATGSGRQVERVTVALVHLSSAILRVGASLSMAASSTHLNLTGGATWSGVHSSADVDGQALPTRAGLLEIHGALHVAGEFRPNESVWTFSGEVARVNVEGLSWFSAASAGTAAALGVALLALLFTGLGKGLCTCLIGRSTPGLVKADPYDHPTRRRILEVIHSHQPITVQALRAHVGISATAAVYHLRILQGCEVIQAARPAGHSRRNTTFMLNSGSLQARLPRRFDNDQVVHLEQALSSVNTHPLRSAIFACALGREAVSYGDIEAYLRECGHVDVPRSTVSRHLSALMESGALRGTWLGRRKAYSVTVTHEEARTIQYRSFLIMHGLLPVFKAVLNGTLRSEKQIDQNWPRAEWQATKERLRTLRRLAIVEADASSGALGPSPWMKPLAQRIAGEL